MGISGQGRETTDGARNDLTRQYIDSVGDTSPRVFFSTIEDRVDFNHSSCLGFTMLTTNSSNPAPLMLIVGPPGPFPLVVFSLVVDNAGVTLTFDQANVTFPTPQFANGNPHQLQICTDGTMATLYSNCGSLDSLPFATGSSAVDYFVYIGECHYRRGFRGKCLVSCFVHKTTHDIRRELISIVDIIHV